MNQQRNTPITDVMTIGVPVADQDRALAFYLDKLGLDKRRDLPSEQLGGRWIEVGPPGAKITIALVPAAKQRPAGVQTGIRLTTPDAERLHRELESRGVAVDELLRWPGVPPMFSFSDEDGNGLEIVEIT